MAERVQSPFNLIKGPDGDPEFFVPASTIDERLLKLRRKIKALSSKDTRKLKRKAIQLLDREAGKLLSSPDMRFIQAEDPKPISGPIEINKEIQAKVLIDLLDI